MSRSRPRASSSSSVCLVSLGCSKNLVDSEVMAGHLGRAGLGLVGDPLEADVVVVNTCGFIDAARDESIAAIEEMVALKRSGDVRGVVVTGCLVQYQREKLAARLPDVDAFLPLSDYSGVPSIVKAVLGGTPADLCPTGTAGGAPKGPDADLGRALLTPVHTAYLRLGEGCNHVCAFCAIPKIRGKLKSKPLPVLVEEAAALASLGTVELTLVAEDSTDYGKDLGEGYGLADLLEALGEVPGLRWVRVMYAHPATIDERLIETLGAVPNVAPYLDMPVQHGDAGVLKRMRRGTSPERIRQVVGRLREAVPGLTLRTTLLTGFPGESDAAFASMLALLEELRFDRVGCFVFSPEASTEAGSFTDVPPREVAEERQARVMALARAILEEANAARVGSTETLLVDAVEPLAGVQGGLAVARSIRDAPEVDGRVLLSLPAARGSWPRVGQFVAARVTGTRGYDLVAELAEAPGAGPGRRKAGRRGSRKGRGPPSGRRGASP